MSDFVTPPPCRAGDQVAVVAPAANPAPEVPHVLDLAEQRLRDVFDLEPVRYPTAEQDSEWLYDHPEARAEDIHDAFRDPDIHAVFAILGGNDQVRIRRHLDTDLLRDNPTRFFGSSDNSHLHNELWKQGIQSFYGGNLMTDLAVPGFLPDYNEASIKCALTDDSMGEFPTSDAFIDQDLDWREPDNIERTPAQELNDGPHWRGGDQPARGRLWGGCLEVVDTILAADNTPPLDDLEDAVVCIETSEEIPDPAEVRRFLYGLGERGILPRASAVLVGRPKARSHRIEKPKDEREAYRQEQYDTITEVVSEYNPDAPVVCGLDFGHTVPTFPLPLGAEATVDPDSETITFH